MIKAVKAFLFVTFKYRTHSHNIRH